MSNIILQMHIADSVGIALRELRPGETLRPQLTCQESVPAGHKLALRDITNGETIRKYDQVIGVASADIKAGSHVHVHNLRYVKVEGQSPASAAQPSAAEQSLTARNTLSFEGYRRPGGRVGTRNYVGVMATVNCSATAVARICRHFDNHPILQNANVDGVIPITHQSGCGIAGGASADLVVLRRVLSGYLTHANFYGWLVIGLGCEVNQAEGLLAETDQSACGEIHTLGIQEEGGTSATIAKGVDLVEGLLEAASKLRRETAPVSELRIGLQCGGSDGWSGITANPALGAAVDRLVSFGGGAILAETPEIYGAEQLLVNRSASSGVATALQRKVNWWHDHLERHDQNMNNNPSPGNLAGGITTILEKSLGAVAKSGTTQVQGVLNYAEMAATPGLLFMDSPGYDPCSVTGEIAAGANLICFTTGRGSTFGAAGAPTLKLASNHQLYKRMAEDMDLDCGAIASGDAAIDTVGDEIFQRVLDTASGRQTASEKLGLGEYEFVPWAPGAVV